MNKVTLKYELDLDFVLIAITSSLKDYRLCYFINKFSGLNLHKIDDHEVWIPTTEGHAYFSRYADYSEVSETECYLIANKSTDGILLIQEMRHSDYFLIIKSFIDEEDLELLQERLIAIDDVVAASEISPQKLKSKENLIF